LINKVDVGLSKKRKFTDIENDQDNPEQQYKDLKRPKISEHTIDDHKLTNEELNDYYKNKADKLEANRIKRMEESKNKYE
jgi:hypothetical protein